MSNNKEYIPEAEDMEYYIVTGDKIDTIPLMVRDCQYVRHVTRMGAVELYDDCKFDYVANMIRNHVNGGSVMP